MKNLEIKVQVNSFENLLQRVSFAEKVDTLFQKDTYLLLGKNRLKIREQKTTSEVIFYMRANKKDSKESHYFRFQIPKMVESFFKKMLYVSFTIKTVVIKKRILYIYKNTRIHVDEVENLGSFLELETVINANLPDKIFTDEHEDVKNRLELCTYTMIPSSYSDLLLNRESCNRFVKV